MMLTADQIKSGLAGKFQLEKVPLPELGPEEAIYVRTLDGLRDSELNDRDWPIGKDGKVVNNRKGREARWIAAAACDMTGKYVFTPADEAEIAQWNRVIRDRIFAAVNRVNEIFDVTIAAAIKN
jgi:hypothetical protein